PLLGGVTSSSFPSSGGFVTSCDAELRELMKQIDIMVAHKKCEWEGQIQALEACLSVREQELSSTRAALQEKSKEVGMLRHQIEDMEKAKQDMLREYEQQLKEFREELSRLRRSYEKMQRKQPREARGEANKRQEEDQSEMSRLTKKLEEFHQKSLGWEKQRLLYQQQVASLEAQRKALAEQSVLMQQTQLANRKQILESVELASQLEIQHLSSELERANDTICAKELEVERLNVRVDELTENNRMILEDQQRVQEELRQSKKMLEVLQDEKLELRATLQSQKDLIDSSKLQQEQLQKELARATETLHTKELLISTPQHVTYVLSQLAVYGVKKDWDEVVFSHEREAYTQCLLCRDICFPVLGFHITTCNTLVFLLKHLLKARVWCVHIFLQLKEQLSQAEQAHSSELEGMKREISRLTQELHQRDITIASASGSTSDLEQRLRTEIERAERKAVEHRVTLVQLETVRLENRHLSEMLDKTVCGMLE
ncbi:CEP63 protein, partial [Syrrhaptes paradoxus]|nr:CEP63 protein [Syrrhaptes paradoxus]